MNFQKISLSKYQLSDFKTYHSLVNEDDVMRYISEKGLSEEKAKLKFNSIINVNKSDKSLGYFKVLNTDGIFIGDCKLERSKHEKSVLEVGYILKKQFWAMGYGTSICKELLTLAETVAPELNIVGIIDPDNIASKKLLQKFGFVSFFVGMEDEVPTEKLILKKD